MLVDRELGGVQRIIWGLWVGSGEILVGSSEIDAVTPASVTIPS
jgi:hypothetical protein